MIRSFLLFSLFLIISPFLLFSQGVGIDQWRTHLPLHKTESVGGNMDKIYASGEYGVVIFDRKENSLERLTRVNGLNDLDIMDQVYHEGKDILLLAYKNTNLDLIKDNIIVNIRSILESNAIPPGEKQLHSATLVDDYAYLACDFGIVVLDVVKEEIVDTYYLGPSGDHIVVNEVEVNDTAFIVATEKGVFWADRENPNLSYYESWNLMYENPNPESININHLEIFNDIILINQEQKYSWGHDTIYFYQNGFWNYNTELFAPTEVNDLLAIGDTLYFLTSSQVKIYNSNLQYLSNIYTYGEATSPAPKDIFIDSSDTLWIADFNHSLVKQLDNYHYKIYAPKGISTADIFDFSSEEGKLWMVHGGMDGSWNNQWMQANLYSFIDEKWSTYNSYSNPELTDVRDFVNVCVNPFDPETVFFGSWNKGLFEYRNGEYINNYDSVNSSLQPDQYSTAGLIRVGGLAFDSNGNLWVSNSKCSEALSVRINDGTIDGKWYSYDIGVALKEEELGRVVIDDIGQKWMLTRKANTLFVFNDNNTLDDISDDHHARLSNATGNGNIFGTVYSLALDHDGEMWVGTDAGIGVIYSPENVFSDYSFDAQRILIPREDNDTLADILLENNKITAIEVDGSNKKWIGTGSAGVFLISDDGLEEIHHFTKYNSPLLSNNILDIEINDVTGEVFFGTDKGIISYKGMATKVEPPKTNVYAYPNPVRPDYSGPIAINGLSLNADFKVTDISGGLVYEGVAEGSQAIWNGMTLDGRKVKPGVYLVFSSDELGDQTFVTKILFVQ